MRDNLHIPIFLDSFTKVADMRQSKGLSDSTLVLGCFEGWHYNYKKEP